MVGREVTWPENGELRSSFRRAIWEKVGTAEKTASLSSSLRRRLRKRVTCSTTEKRMMSASMTEQTSLL